MSIQVVLFGYTPAASSCCDPASGCCGPTVTPADLAAALERELAGVATVRSVDTFSLESFDYHEVLEAIRRQKLPLPVLTVDGTPRLWGPFSVAQAEAVVRELAAARKG